MSVATNSLLTRPEEDLPVKYDDKGNVRILVVGNSGTGKSTVANRLGSFLNFPVVHLDEVYFRPNWVQIPRDEFRELIRDFIDTNDSWIIDGDFRRRVGDLTFSRATTIVWMDPPFILYFPRLILRTFSRLFGWTPPCSPGCGESLRSVFTLGKESILWWSWTHHLPQREFYSNRRQADEAHGNIKWVRLGGWGSESRDWLSRVESLLKSS